MNVYERLGVRTVINAQGTVTILGGSLMDARVLAAMAEASRAFVDLPQLLEKAGQRIAELIGVEAAYITSGAAAGLVLTTAACMSGQDAAKVARLPDTTGMRHEVIVQRCQCSGWEQSAVQAGAKLVLIGSDTGTATADLENSIGENTAAILYFTHKEQERSLPLRDVIEIAHVHAIPVIVDAAAELPPIENLRGFNTFGADLVVFSGGKMIRGPQSTGLILGRPDLVAACALNSNPYRSIGRPMKVGKEEVIGLVRAVELFMEHDFAADLRTWERQVAYFLEAFRSLPGFSSRRVFPGDDHVLPRDVPRVYLTWDVVDGNIPPAEAAHRLLVGDPAIAVRTLPNGLIINPTTLQDGEEVIVAQRVLDVFAG